MTGRIPSAGYKAGICTAGDCYSVQPQLQHTFVSGSGNGRASVFCQLNDALNFKGERVVFVLNNLLNDCECSKPSS